MAVVDVNEKTIGERCKLTTKQSFYTRVFVVRLDDPADGPVVAVSAVGVPSVGDAHPDKATAKAISVEPQPTESRLQYLVRVEYQTSTGYSYPANPLDEDPQISWGAASLTEVASKDIYGNPILNSAKDWFDPPIEKERSLPQVTIVQNEATYDPAAANAYYSTVNNASVTIDGYTAAKRTAMLTEMSASAASRNGVDYYVVTYQIQFKPETYDRPILDQGLFFIDTADESDSGGEYAGGGSGSGSAGTPTTGKKKRIQVNGQQADTPQRLDGSGGILNPHSPPSDSVYLTYRVYSQTDFSVLGLPT